MCEHVGWYSFGHSRASVRRLLGRNLTIRGPDHRRKIESSDLRLGRHCHRLWQPVVALCRVFAQAGVPIEEAEAREDMGRAKRDHIAALLTKPRISEAWTQARGVAPASHDIDILFSNLGPLMRDAGRDCAVLMPGTAEVVRTLRARRAAIGSCTGYSREMMMDILSPCYRARLCTGLTGLCRRNSGRQTTAADGLEEPGRARSVARIRLSESGRN